MAPLVCSGAQLMCSFGTAPGILSVLPDRKALAGTPIAAVTDIQPVTNVAPFALCMSLSNPAVASATAAAGGVLTPQPCTPMIAGPWAPGCTKTLVGGVPALCATDRAACSYGGVIQIVSPGQVKTLANA